MTRFRYVRMTTVAPVMGVSNAWLRTLVYQRVMDDEREMRVKGSPYIMHVLQCFQALIARKMRDRNIGYDLIRDAVDAYQFDGRRYQFIPVQTGIDIRLDKEELFEEAGVIMQDANNLQYGYEEMAV